MQSAPCAKNPGTKCFHEKCIRAHVKNEAMEAATAGGTNPDLLILDDIKTDVRGDGVVVVRKSSLDRFAPQTRDAVLAACTCE